MPIVKVKHGLLEEDNFYLTSPVMDFLGGGSWSRTEEKFRLKSGTVKRRLPYKSFMIDVKKEAVYLTKDSEFKFFIAGENNTVGLKEEPGDEPVTDWRIIYYDGFIQTYASGDNGVTWEEKGGCKVIFEGDLYQGFQQTGSQDLVITDYKVYRSPYLTLQNFTPGALARLTDSNGSILERYFNEWYECNLFLERITKGIVNIFDEGECVFTSKEIDFVPGDIFLNTSDYIQLIYNEHVLDYRTTDLKTENESFIIKNAGVEDTHDVHLKISNNCSDLIEISFDGSEWDTHLYIDKLESGEERGFLLRISKDTSIAKFKVNHFDIIIY